MPRPTYIHRQTLRTQDPSPEKFETQKSLKPFKLKYTLGKKRKNWSTILQIQLFHIMVMGNSSIIYSCKGLKGLKVINTDHRNLMESSGTDSTHPGLIYSVSIIQMSQQSWTWRTWTGRRCVSLDHWTPTPSLWHLSQLLPPTSLIRGLFYFF